ncbi:hypothetical protein BDV93DRAFT_420625, partial [Ceratobasidium sp. AG-I]
RTSNDLRWAVVRMRSQGYHVDKIETTLTISRRQIYKILEIFRATGGVQIPIDILGRGRPRMLSYDEIWYLTDQVGCDPDSYLDELQQGLS